MFLSPLKVKHLGGKWWETTDNFPFVHNGMVFIAPKGFVIDFASVPRLPLAYMLTGNTHHPAAVIHDMLYRWHFVSRKEADFIFMQAMILADEDITARRALGYITKPNRHPIYQKARLIRRKTMYRAVRIAGKSAYKSRPGQLDPRKGYSDKNFYKEWKKCIMSFPSYLASF